MRLFEDNHQSIHYNTVVSKSRAAGRYLAADQLIPDREITNCILVVTPLAFWACDWLVLPMEALLRA